MFLILKSHISAVNSMEPEGTPDQCMFAIFETNRETSQWHCECQLTSPCGIARLRIGGVRIAGRQLKIYLRLALACEGGEGYENGTKEIKDQQTAPQHHKNPPPTAVTCKGGGGGTGLMLGPTPWCSVAVTRVQAHGLAIDSNSAACTGVWAALGFLALHWVFQPPAVLFSHALSRSNIRCVGLFDPSLGVSTLCMVVCCCVGLAAYVGAGSGEPVTWDTNLTAAELPQI